MKKAQSTIIGSLIAIVITVIFGIAVLSWGSAYLGNVGQGFNSLYMSEQNQLSENFKVEYIYANSSGIYVWVGNYGSQEVILEGVTVSNSSYFTYIPLSSKVPLAPGGLVSIKFSFNLQNSEYQIKVYSTDGAYAVGYIGG
ncbi:MAG: hypothetical protein ACP5NC_01280 [Nitrososphaeria archaeon]